MPGGGLCPMDTFKFLFHFESRELYYSFTKGEILILESRVLILDIHQ
jgi:hypothetical protein